MAKTLKWACLILALVLVMASPALAQGPTPDSPAVMVPNSTTLSGAAIGAGLGAAFTIVGAGIGFGWIGSAALQSMARQPEIAGRIQTAMLIIAALLEGATFFSLIVCILMAGVPKW